MNKTETVHTRVTSEVKKEAENIFNRLGLTTSQAIMLFLNATVNNNGLPFSLTLPSKTEEDITFGSSIAMVDGVSPSKKAVKIMELYSNGDIDYETAEFAIGRLYK